MRTSTAAIAAMLVLPAALGAQGSLVVRTADSLAITGDSAGALAVLDRAIAANPRDAAALHRRGLIAWGLARERRRSRSRSSVDAKRLEVADTSLRAAASLAPDSARYAVDLGRFYLNSGHFSQRPQTHRLFEDALKAAERAGDSAMIADAADELGMSYWRRFEVFANRYLINGEHPDLDRYAGDAKAAQTFVERFSEALSGFPGENDYNKATELFQRAAVANPAHPRALRHVYMSLAERKRWEEMRRAATERLGVSPWDRWAWLARGLAGHRMGDEREADAAFDSALVFLTDDERERFTRLTRLVREKDSTRIAGFAPPVRAAMADLYWLLNDPLWLTPANEVQLEFLSRVTYSELRWTVEDLDIYGADTDRGDIYVRYGPPAMMIGMPPDGGQYRIIWMYKDGEMFVFRAPPSYGTATLDGDFIERAHIMREMMPSRWSNLTVGQQLDSIPVQAARFRAPGDSADLFLVADVPVDKLLRDIAVGSGPLHVDLRMFDNATRPVLRDSSRAVVSLKPADVVPMRAWRPRLGRGTYFYRVEALQPDVSRGARAAGSIAVSSDSTFAASGFGMSDVLLAERVAPRGEASARWSDFNIVPNVGTFRPGQTIDLLWENYELGQQSGTARYRVSIELKRDQSSGAGAWIARVVGGAAGAVGVSGRGKQQVSLAFDRTGAWAPALADYVSLELGEAAPGSYRVTVEVTDQVTRKRVSREARLTIAP